MWLKESDDFNQYCFEEISKQVVLNNNLLTGISNRTVISHSKNLTVIRNSNESLPPRSARLHAPVFAVAIELKFFCDSLSELENKFRCKLKPNRTLGSLELRVRRRSFGGCRRWRVWDSWRIRIEAKVRRKKICAFEKSFESKIQEEKTGSHERSSYPLEQLALRESSLPKHGVAKTGSVPSNCSRIHIFFQFPCFFSAVIAQVSVWIETEPVSLPLIKKNRRASLSAVAKNFSSELRCRASCALLVEKVIEGESLQTESRTERRKKL